MNSTRLAAAYALDLIAGDPQGMPHPVRLMGAAISTGERWLRRAGPPSHELFRGAALTGGIVGGCFLLGRAAIRAGGPLAEIALAWTALATRSLLDEAGGVLTALDAGEIVVARRRLAMIVGRDTDDLDEAGILRALIETVAEGLCDGVAAPLFCLALGGVPLAIAYKSVNTLDSMIGHREEPYLYFGRPAARLDDLANFIPARLTALAIVAAAGLTRRKDARRAWETLRRDGYKHPSPNAGQSEAAMAGALGVRLGGVNYYGGEPSPKPLLGAEFRPPERADARAAFRVVAVASLMVFCAAWCVLRWREGRKP